MPIARSFNTNLVLKLRTDVTQPIKSLYVQAKQSVCHLLIYRSCTRRPDSWLRYYARCRKTQIKYSRVDCAGRQPQKGSLTYPQLASYRAFLDDQFLLDGMQARLIQGQGCFHENGDRCIRSGLSTIIVHEICVPTLLDMGCLGLTDQRSETAS